MGDASNVRLAIAEETTFGVVPGANTFSFLRFSNDNLRHAQDTNESDEIDPLRQPPGFLRVSRSAAGGFTSEDSLIAPAEISGGTQNGFDLPIEGAMQSDWSAVVAFTNRSINITVPGTGGAAFDLDDVGAGGAFSDIVVGQWVRCSGFPVNDDVYAHVLTKNSSSEIYCEGIRIDPATGIVTSVTTTESGETTISVRGSMIRIGTTRKSYSIEKQFDDITRFSMGTGLVVGTWDWGVSAQQTVRHTFGFLGRRLASDTTTGISGSTQAKWNTPRLTAPFDVIAKLEASFNAPATHRISEINHRLDNRIRTDFEVGSDAPEVGLGTPSLTGNFNVFMDDITLQQKLEDNTLSKLGYLLSDGTRYRLVTFPAARYTSGGSDAAGRDQPVVQQLAFAAEPDTTDGVAMQLDRF